MTIETIEPDVLAVARGFGLDPALLQAVVNAEGDIVRAAVHAMCDWIKAAGNDRPERKQSFVAFWATRWAPVGAANDPKNLNQNWARNVQQLWSVL